MTLKDQLSQLLNEHGIPVVIRTLTQIGGEKYSEAIEQRFSGSVDYQAEPSREVRREHDLCATWLKLSSIDWIAYEIEKMILHAGESNAERGKRGRDREIELAEKRLAALKSGKPFFGGSL